MNCATAAILRTSFWPCVVMQTVVQVILALQLRQHEPARVPVIAVADEDDVLGPQGVLLLRQLGIRLGEGRIDIGHVARLHRLHAVEDLAAVGARRPGT